MELSEPEIKYFSPSRHLIKKLLLKQFAHLVWRFQKQKNWSIYIISLEEYNIIQITSNLQFLRSLCRFLLVYLQMWTSDPPKSLSDVLRIQYSLEQNKVDGQGFIQIISSFFKRKSKYHLKWYFSFKNLHFQ